MIVTSSSERVRWWTWAFLISTIFNLCNEICWLLIRLAALLPRLAADHIQQICVKTGDRCSTSTFKGRGPLYDKDFSWFFAKCWLIDSKRLLKCCWDPQGPTQRSRMCWQATEDALANSGSSRHCVYLTVQYTVDYFKKHWCTRRMCSFLCRKLGGSLTKWVVLGVIEWFCTQIDATSVFFARFYYYMYSGAIREAIDGVEREHVF